MKSGLKKAILLIVGLIMIVGLAWLLIPNEIKEVETITDSYWLMHRGNQQHTGLSSYNTKHVDGTKIWEFKAEHGIGGDPVIGKDGTIYFGSEDTNFYAFNSDGTEKWRFNTGGSTASSAAIGENGDIYFLSVVDRVTRDSAKNELVQFTYGTATFFALKPDGTLKWENKLGGVIDGKGPAPIIGDDGIIFVSGGGDHQTRGGGKFYALNPDDGSIKWQYGITSYSTPAIGQDGTLYMAGTAPVVRTEFVDGIAVESETADGYINDGPPTHFLHAFSQDGTMKWRLKLGGPNIVSAPAIGADGTIYIGSNDNRTFYMTPDTEPPSHEFWGKIWAVNPDGTVKWHYMTSTWVESSAAIGADGTIYIGCNDKHLYAFNPDGTIKWKYKTGKLITSSPIISNDGTIYIGSGDGYFYALNSDGTLKWKVSTQLGGGVPTDGVIGEDGTIYFGAMDSYFYAIGSSSKDIAIVEELPSKYIQLFTNPIMVVLTILSLTTIGLMIYILYSKRTIVFSKKRILLISLIIIFLISIAIAICYGRGMLKENNDNDKEKEVTYNRNPYPLAYTKIEDITFEADDQELYITFKLEGEIPDMKMANEYKADKLTEFLLAFDIIFEREDKYYDLDSYEQRLITIRTFDGGHNHDGIVAEYRCVFSVGTDIYSQPKFGGMISSGGSGKNYVTVKYPLQSLELPLDYDLAVRVTSMVVSKRYPQGAAYDSLVSTMKVLPKGNSIEIELGELKAATFTPIIITNNNSAMDNQDKN